jgi:hypothetical protein
MAVVDTETQQITTLGPDLTKTASNWLPYESIPLAEGQDLYYPNVTDRNVLIDLVGNFAIPSSRVH